MMNWSYDKIYNTLDIYGSEELTPDFIEAIVSELENDEFRLINIVLHDGIKQIREVAFCNCNRLQSLY